MKYLCLFLLLGSLPAFAQKPTLTAADYKDWEKTLVNPTLTSDGRFAFYTLRHASGKETLIITDLKQQKQKQIHSLHSAVYLMQHKKMAAFKAGGDTLYLVSLNKELQINKLSHVNTFNTNAREYLTYTTEKEDELILYHTGTKAQTVFKKVKTHFFSADGHWLYMTQQTGTPAGTQRIMAINLQTLQVKPVAEHIAIHAMVADSIRNQLVFTSIDAERREKIGYYAPALEKPVDIDLAKITGKIKVDTIKPYFNKSGENIFFTLLANDQTHRTLHSETPAVRIWSYRDSLFQSEIKNTPPFSLYTFHIPSKQIFQVTNEDEELASTVNGTSLLVRRKFKTNRFWEASLQTDTYLVNVQTGQKTKLPEKFSNYESNPFFSPNRQYLVNFFTPDLHYYVYEVKTGAWRNLSKQIQAIVYGDDIDRIVRRPYGIAGWYDEDHLLIYDQYDIWKVNVKDDIPAQNLTRGIGRKNRLIFSYVYEDRSAQVQKQPFMLLSAFDRETKANGFWTLRENAAPVKQHMDSYVYHIGRINSYGFEFPKGMRPLKAAQQQQYIVRRESATEHPNLFSTTDFKSYLPISDLAPQKAYNWLSSTLLSWKMTDGRMSQGILYKPENFDPQKKYPVIFHYYQRKSDKLNEYLIPQLSGATLDIPTYVSNGYLVFVPDIYYSFGKGNGESALNAVESAALFLRQFDFVDGNRMGLQAHSHGGSQTNFIITHSTLFAAACEVAGTANLISSYGQLTGRGASRQPGGEVGFMGIGFGIGKTPWTTPDLYIRNSPVFYIDKVTTPMLIVHGDKDTALPFEQSIELFTALRRAGKPAWFLEYLNAGHVFKEKQAEDFTRRMRQFFDHFLMDKPRPGWMN